MIRSAEVFAQAQAVGFTHVGTLAVSRLAFLPQVREMCAADRCHKYGKSWVCPPGCGSLADAEARARRYSTGVLLQSTGMMEDDFDVETIAATEKAQQARFMELVTWLRQREADCMPMASGACTVCPQCTYPDAPCRFPNLAIPSMEAFGLLVSDTCKESGLPYYYGPRTMTFTGCILFSGE
ncbi:MAG: DUF2284 domain-containing protein [Oscillospiraceae bacterium]